MAKKVKPDEGNGRPRRKYDASGRRARANRTRQDVIEAARRLFVERGFVTTTVSDIAAAAHVSPETIYKTFGSKTALVAAVARALVRGDADATPLRERSVIAEIRAEPDARTRLERYARLLAEVQPRVAPIIAVIREASRSDPALEATLRQLEADRLDGMTEFASLFAKADALRDGLSARTAADVLWTFNSPEMYELLVVRRGWSLRRYEKWIAEQLAAALLR
jgi:AcrR family transcriptional regulator